MGIFVSLTGRRPVTILLPIPIASQICSVLLPFPRPLSDCYSIYRRPRAYRRLLIFHSHLATRISNSSSLTGIHDVRTFIALSKSESSIISRIPSIKAAETACRTSSVPLKDGGTDESDVGLVFAVGLGIPMAGFGSPNSMKTSQTRSWAGNGME